VIGLTGETRGTISVSFTKICQDAPPFRAGSFTEASILPIVSNMLGEEMKELNEEIKDAVGEITNMISGQARKKLEELGRTLKAAIPTVITGRDHAVKHVTTYPIIAIPFTTDSGEFTIEVCFEE